MGVHRSLGENMNMDGMGMASLWGYQQQETAEELKQRLFFTTVELQSLRESAKEEMRKQEEFINQLTQLVKVTSQERDEARDQLMLLKKLMQSSNPVNVSPIASYLQPESPQIRQTRGTPSNTESDSLSDTQNRNNSSYVSSPVESFFNPDNSPELPNINMADSHKIPLPQPVFFPLCVNTPGRNVVPRYDQATARTDAIIDQLVMKKGLPEKGKLVQAVMDSGPLLHNLMTTGTLPEWRNPPQVQPYQIPPLAIKGPINQASSMGALCLSKRPMGSPCVSSCQGLNTKKQKVQ